MSVAIQRRQFTVEDYYKMAEVGILKPDDRVELIRGEIIKMTPIKSAHASKVNYLLEFLILNFHKKATIVSQNPIRLSQESEPEPDIAIAIYKADRYSSAHPTSSDVLLVIEVADSSLAYDQTVKSRLYAKAAIPEYWIVNIPDQQLEIYRMPMDSNYVHREILHPDQTVICQSFHFRLPLKALFV